MTLARDMLSAYSTYSEVFEIYTDASKQQLGIAIMQNNQPIAISSRKLSKSRESKGNQCKADGTSSWQGKQMKLTGNGKHCCLPPPPQ